METEEEKLKSFDKGLQQWQKEILEMSPEEWKFIHDEDWTLTNESEIPITQSQARMLEKVLSDEFFIGDEKVRDTLQCVLELGFYYERDKVILNLARECYLKGRNWIKKRK